MPIFIRNQDFTPGAMGSLVFHANYAPAVNNMPLADPAAFQLCLPCEAIEEDTKGGSFDTPHYNEYQDRFGGFIMPNQNGNMKYDMAITIKANPKFDFPRLHIPRRTPIWFAHTTGILFQHQIFLMLINDVKKSHKTADSVDITITGRIRRFAYQYGICLNEFAGVDETTWDAPGDWEGVTPTTTGGLKETDAGTAFIVGSA